MNTLQPALRIAHRAGPAGPTLYRDAPCVVQSGRSSLSDSRAVLSVPMSSWVSIAEITDSGWRFMQLGRGRSIGWAGLLTPLLVVAGGCVTNRAQIEQAMIAPRSPSPHSHQLASGYRTRCPDVLQVDIAGLPQYSGTCRIGPDGRIDLGDAGRPQVDGQTIPEVVRIVAETISVPPEQVRAAVAEYDSQFLYLYGQGTSMQQVVTYRGPETIVDLLRRVGGMAAGASLHDVKVIRPHVADGKTPEVFTVDLAAIVLRNNPETNLVLEPFDQIHIGQSRRSTVGDYMPPWFRPIYERMCGMRRGYERSQQQLGIDPLTK